MGRVARWLRLALISFFGFFLLLYLLFALGLKAVELVVSKHEAVEDSVGARSRQPHQLRHYDQGLASFQRRLELIQSAQKSIELEFFIYDLDEAGRLITRAVVDRAKAGVKVRILVDFSLPVFQLKPAYADYLAKNGIAVKYYNTSPVYRVLSSQHRSHRKLLIVDGQTVLTGGRNIADEYFDLAPDYNFLDSDVEVSGPLVRAVTKSFDLYWNSALAKDPEPARAADGTELFAARPGDVALFESLRARSAGKEPRGKAHECRDLTFVTDFPNHGEQNRKVFAAIVEALREVKRDVWVETPYFVINSGGREILRSLHEKNIRLNVLTNSLASTDASYAVGTLYSRLRQIGETGLSLHAYRGEPLANQSGGLPVVAPRWGIHAKRAVLDDDTVLIGTYNVDPRSANLNSELMFVCRGNKELAAEVLASMRERVAGSDLIIDQGKIVGAAHLTDSPFKQKLIFWLSMPLARTFDFLL